MKIKIHIILFLLFKTLIFAQKPDMIEVRGRVIDVSKGDLVGISGVTVSVGENDYDITDKNGNFKLSVLKTKENVKITLENTKHTLISPYAGLVNLPPSAFINIKVCKQENERLQNKVNALNQTIKKLENKHNFNKRQLVNMQQELLDTILFFEKKVVQLENLAKASTTENVKLIAEIKVLNDSLQSLSMALTKAKEEKYLRQQSSFAMISSDLKRYLDALENLTLMLEDNRIEPYFNASGGYYSLYEKINAYNEARKNMLERQDANVKAVAHYWENSDLTAQCEATYNFALQTVHDKTVFPLNKTVLDVLKEYSAHPIGKSKAIKEVKKGVNEARPKLLPQIEDLRKQINDLISNLKFYN